MSRKGVKMHFYDRPYQTRVLKSFKKGKQHLKLSQFDIFIRRQQAAHVIFIIVSSYQLEMSKLLAH